VAEGPKPLVGDRRDGTSQAHRTARALDPARYPVDGRTLRDALRFALEQGRTLPYHDANDRPAGTWGAFLGDEGFLDQVEAFLKDPTRFTQETSPALFRPHLTLFLAFLRLFEEAQAQLGTLTRRHLDFYYRELLRLTAKGPLPDRVNVLFELSPDSAPDSAEAEVPAGSLVSAGQDSLGSDLLYRTDQGITVNRASIARVSSVFVQHIDGRFAGLWAAADATSVPAESESDERLGWKTFGQAGAGDEDHLGWAVSSPLLALADGNRSIKLTLKLVALPPSFPVRFEVSTRDGFRHDFASKVTVNAEQVTLVCELTFGDDFPPIEPFAADPDGIAGQAPALRLLLKPEPPSADHDRIFDLALVDVSLAVGVSGLSPSALQNDEGPLAAEAPFEPFGSTPAVGARFLLGHPELSTKKLDELTFDVDWVGLPGDLPRYYETYGKPWSSGDFKVLVSAIVGHERRPLGEAKAFTGESFAVDVGQGNFATGPAGAFGPDLTTWRRYLSWELRPIDFGVARYPIAAAEKASALAFFLAGKAPDSAPKPGDFVVNPPYTPELARLTVDYTASLERGPVGADVAQFFHVHPFGHAPISRASSKHPVRLLPDYPNEGELYIGLRDTHTPGLRDTHAPAILSLLVQMVEGPPDPDLPRPDVVWSYLDGNAWKPLSVGGASESIPVLLDTTRGLTQSGILQLALPLPEEASTRLPGDLYWIRAAVKEHSAALSDTVALYTQAVSATFAEQGNAPDHYDSPLPERTITQLSPPIPAIARVVQPYTSTGGRPTEAAGMFDTRVSERLRHKQRALSTWDYERLVLERFPQIYKAKCIPASAEGELGVVRVVVIPDVRKVAPRSRYEPKAPTGLLAEIREYLETMTPAAATVEVHNALYVPVTVDVQVDVKGAGNAGEHYAQTEEAIKQFLSPWAYDGSADITFGATLYANSVVAFLQHLPYIGDVLEISVERPGGDALDRVIAGRNEVLTTSSQHTVR
jgi:Baseplate J-like protein